MFNQSFQSLQCSKIYFVLFGTVAQCCDATSISDGFILVRSEGVCTKMDVETGKSIQIFRKKYKKEHKVSRNKKLLRIATFVYLKLSETQLNALHTLYPFTFGSSSHQDDFVMAKL